ncbi:hypothetical protein U8335_03875 [Roseiconus lacunae]|uniref:hypothetical protein n=1 Tax=Roseiconus lacunae TaxID=2605694 RepID=UPI003087B4D4|nr:hypothetical protein U8335_03875 [Stieleria sp. HD01]
MTNEPQTEPPSQPPNLRQHAIAYVAESGEWFYFKFAHNFTGRIRALSAIKSYAAHPDLAFGWRDCQQLAAAINRSRFVTFPPYPFALINYSEQRYQPPTPKAKA